MNSVAIKRIAWKEFRQQIVFFAALIPAAIVVTAVLSLLLDSSILGESAENGAGPLMLIGMFAALYAAATGGTLYATEREERTQEFLRRLPLESGAIRSGKFVVAVGLCLVFFAATLLFAAVLGSGSLFLGTFGIAVIEFFAWSLLFSLLSTRPLVAAVLGIGVASAVIQILTGIVNGSQYEPFTMTPYANAWLPRLVVAAIVLGVDFWLAGRWLGGTRSSGRMARGGTGSVRSMDDTEVVPPGSISSAATAPRTARMFLRFVWQAIRSSRSLLGVYLLVMAGLIGLSFVGGGLAPFCVLGVTALASIAGVFPFTPDKTDRANAFLARHADRPGLYWLAHTTVWMSWIVAVNVLAVAVALLVATIITPTLMTTNMLLLGFGAFQETEYVTALGTIFLFLMFAGWATLGMLFCFAGGQLCSMLIDSRILAAIAAVVLAIPQLIWFILMMASETPLYWSVLPLGLALLGGGWLATRWWFANQRSGLRIAGIAMGVLVVWGITAAAVINKRANEIPLVESRVADYRTERGEPDQAILNEMRQRFATAIDGLEGSDDLYEGVLFWLDQVPVGQPLDAESIKDTVDWENESDWEVFLERHPEATVEDQLARAMDYVASNRDGLDQLQAAIQFATDNFDHILRMEPALVKGRTDGNPLDLPPLPAYVTDSRVLLRLGFFQAMRDGDAVLAWDRLKSLMSLQHIRKQIYAGDMNRLFYWQAMFHQWAIFAAADNEELLREALEFVQSDILDHVDPSRIREANRLQLLYGAPNPHVRPNALQRWTSFVYDLLPWERERTRRLIDLWTRWRVESVKFHYRQADDDSRVPHETLRRRWETGTGLAVPKFGNYVDNTIFSQHGGGYLGKEMLDQGRQRRDHRWGWTDPWYRQEQERTISRRLIELGLATMIWQHENGQLPDSLNDMVGTLIDVDPDEHVPPMIEVEDFRLIRLDDDSALIWRGGVRIWNAGLDFHEGAFPIPNRN